LHALNISDVKVPFLLIQPNSFEFWCTLSAPINIFSNDDDSKFVHLFI
jgi:hypothetical protein